MSTSAPKQQTSTSTYTHPMTKNPLLRSTAMNLIHEALARARMRSPQTNISEANSDQASRGARQIAIGARRNQARDLGHLPLR